MSSTVHGCSPSVLLAEGQQNKFELPLQNRSETKKVLSPERRSLEGGLDMGSGVLGLPAQLEEAQEQQLQDVLSSHLSRAAQQVTRLGSVLGLACTCCS